MRRETDLLAWRYTAAQAIEILAERYPRIYQDVASKRFVLISPDGKNILDVEESGLSELARSVLYSETLSPCYGYASRP